MEEGSEGEARGEEGDEAAEAMGAGERNHRRSPTNRGLCYCKVKAIGKGQNMSRAPSCIRIVPPGPTLCCMTSPRCQCSRVVTRRGTGC